MSELTRSGGSVAFYLMIFFYPSCKCVTHIEFWLNLWWKITTELCTCHNSTVVTKCTPWKFNVWSLPNLTKSNSLTRSWVGSNVKVIYWIYHQTTDLAFVSSWLDQPLWRYGHLIFTMRNQGTGKITSNIKYHGYISNITSTPFTSL